MFTLPLLWCALVTGELPVERPAVRLEVSRAAGAETCPDAAGLEALVVARLGYSPVQPGAAERMEVAFTSEPAGLVATVRRERPGHAVQTRALRDADRSCGPLAASAAFALALAVDPQTMTAPAPEPPPPSPAVAPTPEPKPRVIIAPAPPPEAPAWNVGWELGAGGAAALGAAPVVNATVVVHGGVHLDRWRLLAELRVDVPSTTPAGTGRVETHVIAGGLLPCVGLSRFLLCGVVGAGALRARSEGLSETAALSAPWAVVGARASVELELGRALRLAPWVDVLVPLTRVTLRVDGQPVWQTPVLGGLAGLRLSVGGW